MGSVRRPSTEPGNSISTRGPSGGVRVHTEHLLEPYVRSGEHRPDGQRRVGRPRCPVSQRRLSLIGPLPMSATIENSPAPLPGLFRARSAGARMSRSIGKGRPDIADGNAISNRLARSTYHNDAVEGSPMTRAISRGLAVGVMLWCAATTNAQPRPVVVELVRPMQRAGPSAGPRYGEANMNPCTSGGS